DVNPLAVVIRRATVEDVPTIARHRAQMFTDMGSLPAELYQPLMREAAAYLGVAVARGEYVGWFACPVGSPGEVVAGAGVQLRRTLPHSIEANGRRRLVQGRQGIVLNVFTEKAWRRRGVAELLMKTVLDWARAERLDTLVLHAAPEGRHLYEKLGFRATNEMRFSGDLSSPPAPLPPGEGGSPS